MRDAVIMLIVLAGALAALRRPWIGVMLWTWVSLLNPHRYAYGFAYNMPVAAIAAGATLLGLLLTQQRESPFKGAPAVLLLVFIGWITLSWLAGLDPAADYPQWEKVMKIFLMTLVTLALLRTKQHMLAFTWVIMASIGFLGVKGGLFTIATAGSYRVWGPPQTFIAENNAFAVAVIITIPLMRFLQLQLTSRVARHAMTGAMLAMAASALGSQSRGAFLALGAMSVLLWWRMKANRLLTALPFVVVALLLVSFMPDSWTERMSTIETYQEDQSAMGRIAAWWVGWRVALHYPFGVGFNAARQELFEAYSPYVQQLDGHYPVAHSIYFQMLGHHGFVGLALFLAIFGSTFWIAGRLRRQAAQLPEARWCSDLGAMAQVSLVGYAVGGAFLDLAYFDLPYNIMVLVVLAAAWLRKRAWEQEVIPEGRLWRMIGLRPIVRTDSA